MTTQPSTPYPPAAPAAAAPTQKPGGLIGIWIGIILMLIGLVGGIALVVGGATQVADLAKDLERVPLRGGTVQIDETGEQTIYAERPAPGSGASFSTGSYVDRPDLIITVTDPSGQRVEVTGTIYGSETYTNNGREGVEVGSFYASQTGTYEISAAAENPGNFTTLAVGQVIDFAGIGMIVAGVIGGGFFVVLGLILLIVFAVKRSRARKRIAMAGRPGGPGGPGWPTPAYAGGAPYGGAPGYPAPGAPAPYGAPGATWTPPPAAAPASTPGWVPPPTVPGAPAAPPVVPVPPVAPPAVDAPPPAPDPAPPADAPAGPYDAPVTPYEPPAPDAGTDPTP